MAVEVYGFESCVAEAAAGAHQSSAPSSRSTGCNAARLAARNAIFDTGDPFDFQIVTDAEESAAGNARHKTIGGRGVVGRLIDKARRP